MNINPIIESKGEVVDITSQVTPVAAYVKDIYVVRSENVVSVSIGTYPNTPPSGQSITIATGLPKPYLTSYGVSLFGNGRNGDGFARVNTNGSVDVYNGSDAVGGMAVSITYITNE